MVNGFGGVWGVLVGTPSLLQKQDLESSKIPFTFDAVVKWARW